MQFARRVHSNTTLKGGEGRMEIEYLKKRKTWIMFKCPNYFVQDCSSLLFTSPLEFNAIFRNGITLRLELNGWSKIRDTVPAKFKHVTNIVTYTLLCWDWITYMAVL